MSSSISGGDDYKNYFVGFERFQTEGISQMMHNDEKDRYRNNSIIASYNYNFLDNFELNSNYRIADTYLQYDAAVFLIGLVVHLVMTMLKMWMQLSHLEI